MTTDVNGVTWPDEAIHPGETLADELEARGLSQRALAIAIGRPPQLVNDIVRGRKGISADTAVGLEQALGISAQTWVSLQARYELTLAYIRAAGRRDHVPA